VLIAWLYARFFRLIAVEDYLLAWATVAGLVHCPIGGLVVAAAFPIVDAAAATARLRRVGFAYVRYGRRDLLTFLGGHVTFGLLVGRSTPPRLAMTVGVGNAASCSAGPRSGKEAVLTVGVSVQHGPLSAP
jgi:hypothetical protein